MDSKVKQLFEQFDTMQTQLIEQALHTAIAQKPPTKMYKLLKNRDFSYIFEQYRNTSFDNVLFTILMEKKYAYIAVFENVALPCDLTPLKIASYPIEKNIAKGLAEIVSENIGKLNILWRKTPDSRILNKWGFDIWE